MRTDKGNSEASKVCPAFLLFTFIFYPTISPITHQEHNPTRTTPLPPPCCHNYPHPIQPDPILNALFCVPWFVFDVCFPFCEHMFFVVYMVTSPS